MDISQLIRYSPKRTFLFNSIKNEVSSDSQGLKPLCPTRWTVRTAAIESVVENYEPLTQAMEAMAKALDSHIKDSTDCVEKIKSV